MRVGIFYFSRFVGPTRLAGDMSRTAVMLLPNGGTCFIRVEEVDAPSAVDARDLAAPRRGETLLNTELL